MSIDLHPEEMCEYTLRLNGYLPEPPRMCQWHPETPAHPESEEHLCVACEVEVWRDEVRQEEEWLAKAEADTEVRGRALDMRWYCNPMLYALPFHGLCSLRESLERSRQELAKWEAIAVAEGANA